jgi:hypothetical protein
MTGVALPVVCDCERMDGRPPIPGMDKSQKLRLRVLLVDATSALQVAVRYPDLSRRA